MTEPHLRQNEIIQFPPHRLEQPINIMVGLHAEKAHSNLWKNSFLKVSLPSFFTKSYARLMMVLGYVPMAGSASFSAFVLANLCFVAPPVAMIAGTARFFIVFWQEYKKSGKFWEACKAAVDALAASAFKFFVVYMAWTLGMALAASLSILSGGMLPVGILLVAGITAVGFMLASFITDILPDIKKKWHKFKEYFTSAFTEGSLWALLDALNLKRMIRTHGAGIEDVIIVTLVVSFAFFIGTFLYSCFSKLRDTIAPIKTITNATLIAEKIRHFLITQKEIYKHPGDPKLHSINITEVESIKTFVDDDRLKDTIEEYIKYKILFLACNKMLTKENGQYVAFVLNKASKDILAHKRVCKFFPLFLCRKTRSLRLLEKAEKFSKNIDEEEATERQQEEAIKGLTKLKDIAETRVEKVQKKLARWGIYSDQIGELDSPTLPSSVLAI